MTPTSTSSSNSEDCSKTSSPSAQVSGVRTFSQMKSKRCPLYLNHSIHISIIAQIRFDTDKFNNGNRLVYIVGLSLLSNILQMKMHSQAWIFPHNEVNAKAGDTQTTCRQIDARVVMISC